MTISYSASIKIAKLDTVETTVGTAPTATIYNGSVPTNADTALAGNTVLALGTLPSDYFSGASGTATVTKAKSGTWTLTGQSGAGTGTVGTFFRIIGTGGTVQGTFGATGSGADMTADNASIANAQVITVSTFTITSGN